MNLKKGDRVQWVYGNGGPGNVAESDGTVLYTTTRGAVAVQWDIDPKDSPTFYSPETARRLGKIESA